MSADTNTNGGGIGVTGLLGVAFVILKLCHVIDWPWIWVLAPFWIGIVLAVSALLVFGVVWGVVLVAKRLR